MGVRLLQDSAGLRPAFTVASLADRWECSTSLVRKLIANGELSSFRLGTLIRISAEEVGRFECQNTQCSVSAADMPSSGTSKASAGEEPYTPQIDRARKPRRAAYGKQAMTARGQLAG
jgi:excisionase family DNA binding protein